MQRLILLLILLNICNLSAAQEIDFKDIPENHWAEKSVRQLVKSGVTSGYPDKTFRGMQNMTREEMAEFLSKLSKNTENASEVEKLGAEIKNEYSTLKYKIENPDEPRISASYTQNAVLGNPFTSGEKGPKFGYRLKVSMFERIGQSGSIKINLDTMDSALTSLNQDLLNKFLDVEGRLKLGNINYKATLGPGPLIFREIDSVSLSRDLVVYSRPKTGLLAQTFFQNLDLMLGYFANQLNSFGSPLTHEVYGKAAFTYNKLPILNKTTVSYIQHQFSNSKTNDLIGEISVASNPTSVLSSELLIGIGGYGTPSGLMGKASIGYKTKSTDIQITAYKFGQFYRKTMDKYSLLYLNAFNKPIADGSVDLGMAITHKLGKKLAVNIKSDVVAAPSLKFGKDFPGTSLTYELGLAFSPAENVSFYSYYRAFSVPSKISDMDPNLSTAVPEISDYIAIEMRIVI